MIFFIPLTYVESAGALNGGGGGRKCLIHIPKSYNHTYKYNLSSLPPSPEEKNNQSIRVITKIRHFERFFLKKSIYI